MPARRLHLAIGMFDGVHLGHQAVIEAAVHSARRCGGFAGVLTFQPHPSRLFRPGNPVRLIMEPESKARRLFQLGVDAVIMQEFDAAFAGIAADEFLPRLKKSMPSLDTIYVGENWRFGRGRLGDVAFLVDEARRRGLNVVSAQRIRQNGEPISSTRIRDYLAEGRMAEANALLGYTYFSRGVVAPGKRLGRTIGFPTLNVPWEPELRPRLGVYAVQVSGESFPESAAPLQGVANYGLRPTVEDASGPLLEIHLLGECPFGRGDRLTVEWLEFLRPEMKFADVDALRGQIEKDRKKAVEFFLR